MPGRPATARACLLFWIESAGAMWCADTHSYGLRSGRGRREEPQGHDGRARCPQDGGHLGEEARTLRRHGRREVPHGTRAAHAPRERHAARRRRRRREPLWCLWWRLFQSSPQRPRTSSPRRAQSMRHATTFVIFGVDWSQPPPLSTSAARGFRASGSAIHGCHTVDWHARTPTKLGWRE